MGPYYQALQLPCPTALNVFGPTAITTIKFYLCIFFFSHADLRKVIRCLGFLFLHLLLPSSCLAHTSHILKEEEVHTVGTDQVTPLLLPQGAVKLSLMEETTISCVSANP